jgi:hypothetical protein
MNRVVKYFFTTACLLTCLLTGCRINAAFSIGKPAIAVQVSPKTLDGNTLDGTVKIADEIKATGP